MAWSLQGEWIESCSCDMLCPCNFGPAGKPDQEWCSAAIGLNIRQGDSDGVDLSNVRAVFVGDFPGNFLLGDGTARLYLDEGMTAEQQLELEAILTGKKGGVWEALGASMSRSVPTKLARISLEGGENPSISVSGVGEMKLERIKDEKGSQTQLVNFPVGTAFGLGTADLALSEGQWSDPEMRSWQAGGHGDVMNFNWQV